MGIDMRDWIEIDKKRPTNNKPKVGYIIEK